MRKRLIGLLLALCYLSVSLSSFSFHFHKHSDALSHQCAACAWHSESVSDVPVDFAPLTRPEVLILAAPSLDLRVGRATPLILSARGPPLLS